MAPAEGKKLLVVIRHSPYGSSLARTSLDVALAAAAFDQPINVLFMGEGVLQLLPEQHSEAIGMKNLGRTLASLPLYDIESAYADASAAARYRLDLARAPVATLPLEAEQMHQLLSAHDHLLGF